ncbi:MAG: hypothetical protein AABX14_03215 [Candidatus Aenigmatarchaeota archaeon]
MANHLARYSAKFGNHPKIAAATANAGSYLSTDLIRRLALIFTDRAYAAAFFDAISPDMLTSMMGFPPPAKEPFEVLQSAKLLPTPEIWAAAQKTGAVELFRAAQGDIEAGRFDYANPLHIELEYSRYTTGGSKVYVEKVKHERKFAFDEFRCSHWLEGKDVILTDGVYWDIDETAKQAAITFTYILGKRNDNPLLVIGNKRYGSYFIVRPIEDRLVETGITVVHEYSPSLNYDHRTEGRSGSHPVSDETLRWINSNGPDIVVVDGTNDVYRNGLTRFPASFWGYINALNLYHSGEYEKWLGKTAHRYEIKFWAPNMTEQFFVGKFTPSTNGNEQCDREATMISSASPCCYAHFDDTEDYIRSHSVYGFAQNGFTSKPLAKDEATFVSAVQREIKERVGKYL